MATYLAHDALRLPAASLLANSGLCVNIEIKIWLLLGVNVDTAIKIITLVYLPADIISDNDFAASFFSATFRTRTIATSALSALYRTQYFTAERARCLKTGPQTIAAA